MTKLFTWFSGSVLARKKEAESFRQEIAGDKTSRNLFSAIFARKPDEEGVEVFPSPRKTNDGGQQAIVGRMQDHFTLDVPTSLVRYRNSNGCARVIEGGGFQFILEEVHHPDRQEPQLSIRRVLDSSAGLRFLRICYTVVTAFWTGFLLCFCMQILLFLFLDLAIQLGITGRDENVRWDAALGVIFAIVPLIHGLALAMVLAGAFVMDTWRGHHLLRNFTCRALNPIFVEWLVFLFFVGFPVLAIGATMLTGTDDWWVISGVFWVSCIVVFFCLFVANVVWYEIRACFEVMKFWPRYDDDSFCAVVFRAAYLRQTATYGGTMERSYVSRGTIDDSEWTDKEGMENNVIEETLKETYSYMANLATLWPFTSFFETLDTPRRFYTIDDARVVRPFITAHTWSLEKVFCRSRDTRYITIVNGAGAVTRAQMKSSFVCSVVGSFLIFFVIFAVLVWIDVGASATILLIVVAAVVAYPNFASTYRLLQIAKDVALARTTSNTLDATEKRGEDSGGGKEQKEHTIPDPDEIPGGNDAYETERDSNSIPCAEQRKINFKLNPSDSEALYLVHEIYRVTRPTPSFAQIALLVEIALFLVWPVTSLAIVGNYPLAILYFFIIGISGLRHYINAALVLEETGRMDYVDGDSELEKWQNESRLNEIVGNISRGPSTRAWTVLLTVFALAFLGLFAGAVGSDLESANILDPTHTYLQNFEYKKGSNLQYPTCQLTNALEDQSPLTSMADFIFLARLAYRGSITQRELDKWFGEGVAVDQEDFVASYRDENNVDSAVSFKMVTYPSESGPDFAYVAIRGTTNQWDALTDAQLWSAAMLFQVLRELLPFGVIWTPVLPYLINSFSSVESHAISQVSFYQDTTRFTNFVKDQVSQGVYSGVAVTGHSLGGGLAIITGAQAQVPAVALSGPNTLLTRRSLDPPVNVEDLDRFTFNIIPERDVVAMIDDPAQNFQIIRCNADTTDVIGCHDTTRALCESIHSCGSQGRPALCECVTMFGYPKPDQIDLDGPSFDEVCNITTSGSLL